MIQQAEPTPRPATSGHVNMPRVGSGIMRIGSSSPRPSHETRYSPDVVAVNFRTE